MVNWRITTTLLVAAILPLALLAQQNGGDLFSGEFVQVHVDRDGVLYALPAASTGVLKGTLPTLENIGPDVPIASFHITAQGRSFAIGQDGTLYRREGTSDWVRLALSASQVSTVVSDSSGILYAGLLSDSNRWQIHKSTDDGDTWSHSFEFPGRLDFLAASPAGNVYVCGYLVTYFSADGGAVWSTPAPVPGPLTRAIHFTREGEPVAASEYTKLFYYSDSVNGWVEPPRASRLHITAFASPPPRDGAPLVLYACNAIGDIIRSSDSGATWEPLIYGGDYPTGMLNSIAADDEYLYVAAQRGLWRLRHADQAFERYGAASSVIGEPGTANPCLQFPPLIAHESRIRFTLCAGAHLTITLYDVHGRHLRTLLDEARPAGEGSAMLDVTGLAAGVYLCRMNAGGTMLTQKLVVSR